MNLPGKSARPIILDFKNIRLFTTCWLIALSVLIIVLLFRGSGEPSFKAAIVDAQSVMNSARTYIRSNSKYPEFVEVEVIEFAKYVQIEVDALAAADDISIVMTNDIFLGGNAVDYTEYVFIHAKQAYDDNLVSRESFSGLTPSLSGGVGGPN
ncbi:MAG: hypothetical protein ACPGVT_05290 [Maricaulaceae bacterium]